MLAWYLRTRGREHTAAKQWGVVHSEAYRRASPRDLVEQEGFAMSGPGGSPPAALSADERRQRDRA